MNKEKHPVMGVILGTVVFIVILKAVPFVFEIFVVTQGINWTDESIKNMLALGNILGVIGGLIVGYKVYLRYVNPDTSL